ncbi:hypothetical protein M0802_014610 [Mischocyttarus mexicanus]|nr:hypothetical protein M0802_014610 [Mischocyttarus mexicanus]
MSRGHAVIRDAPESRIRKGRR